MSDDSAAVTTLPQVPPVARRIPREEMRHGVAAVDDFFWLREKADPEVRRYLEAENAYCDAVMKPTETLQKSLYDEMLARIQETDLSVPYRKDGWWYYSRTEQGKQYPIHCRKRTEDGEEQVLLDENALAEGQAFFDLGVFAVSDDGTRLAYSTDVTGFREYTLVVKDLATGELLPVRIEKTGSFAWGADGSWFFYATEDAAKRPHRVWRHRLGQSPDELIYEEKDELFRAFVGRTRSRQWYFLGAASHTTTEWRGLPAAGGEWRTITPRRQDHEYEVDHHGESFYIRTNDKGRNFRLVKAPAASPGEEHWVELVPHRAEVMLEGIEMFARHSVLLEREDGLPRFRVTDLATGEWTRIAFPEPAFEAQPGANAEWEATAFRYQYESLVTPASVFDYDVATRSSKLLKQTPVLGGYDPTQYVSERIWATARDGVRIPVDLVHRRGRPRDGTGPAWLTGYGSYGFPYPVRFSSNRLSLLDRGFVYAIGHIRGGSELGKAWHDEGRMMKKRNTFTDFIAVAEHLVAERYTTPRRLAIEGGSAGGLLMGAVSNMRPDLFGVVVSKVPFVDVLNTMSDPTLPLTAGEWEEWGDPRKKEEYDYIASYCPYTNLERKAYPTMLVKTSFNDSQVMYWEPAKYVARLRTLKTDANLLLLKTNLEAGHGGASGRYDFLREVAFDYAFVLWQLGAERT